MRLDLFLKASRLILRRTLAQEFCDAGRVKVNDVKAKSSREVKELDEIEIIAADGTALAYLVAAARPGDATYAKFEAVFQSHSDELHRRAVNLAPGITTQELFSKLDAQTNDTELPCGSR